MVAVAVVAVATGGGILRRRSTVFRKKAAIYAEQEVRALARARELETSAAHQRREANDASETGKHSPFQENWETAAADYRRRASIESGVAGIWRERAADRARGKRKYERAARYPWIPVEPDPPEPE